MLMMAGIESKERQRERERERERERQETACVPSEIWFFLAFNLKERVVMKQILLFIISYLTPGDSPWKQNLTNSMELTPS
jgi:hypothetical protein